MANQRQNSGEQDLNQLLKIRREKLKTLQEEGKDPFRITTYDQTEHSTDIKNHFEEMEGKEVSIAGRMMSKRVMGKASFCDVLDRYDSIQVYVARDQVGEDSYKDFKKYDIGDIFGVKGTVFRTKMGEISVHADQVTLLSKNLVPLPEKFHGLQDTDIRYRQRYLDLIMNRDVRTTFEKRSQIIREIRNFLDKRDFMEVETPMLVENAGGAAARPFVTHYNALDEDVKLRISLELYLKRLIVGGFERVYEIGRVFRNEGVDTRHNPEFTLMELYQAYTDYNGMMELTESMFRYLAEKVCGSAVIQYEDTVIDMAKPFRRLTMIDAVKEYAGVDFSTIRTDEEAKAVAKVHNVEFEERHKRGDIINLFFEQFCEEKMIQPTFIMDHPVEISPLTKRKPSDPSLVERFELYIYGREMCNAYSELNDPIDQRERFKAQDALAAAGDEEANHTDEDFLHAMEIGMPPTGGIGYGIDRLVMLLTNSSAIRDVLLFPTMKSLNGKKDEGNEAGEGSEETGAGASASKTGASAGAAASGNGASATASASAQAGTSNAFAAASASSTVTNSATSGVATGEASGAAGTRAEASGDASAAGMTIKPTPSVPTGVKLDAGISYDDALALLKKYNEDEFHIIHGETVGRLMEYYAKKYDPENAEFWKICGLLHDLDWEKFPDIQGHTVKAADLLEEAGVNMMVAHVIQTHNEFNPSLPKPEHKMEKVLFAADELSGLLGAIVRMYPSKSAQDLNLKSLKKKYKDKRFAAGCDRENIARGAELNGLDLDGLFNSMIEAYKATNE